ncbi:hypothetical protein PGB90_004020 [Kerria lacca]
MELIQTLRGHIGRVWCVSWNHQGNVLASCGEDKNIRLWLKENDNPFKLGLKTILTDGHRRTIRSVCWSHCGEYLASASFDSTVAIWDRKSGEYDCNVTLEGHENEVKSISWSKSGQFLASCSRDKSVWIWEISDEEEYECAAVLNAHTQDVKKVVWHPHTDILTSASYDNSIRMFKFDLKEDDWICCGTLRSHESTVWSIAFDASGKRLASCSDDCTVKIWQEYKPNNPYGIITPNDDSVWKCVCTLSGFHSRTIYDISWCHITGLIATACADDSIRIFKESSTSNINEPIFYLMNVQLLIVLMHDVDVPSVAGYPYLRHTALHCFKSKLMRKKLIISFF